MKKRVLTLALAVLMIFSFVGCSDSTFYDGSHPELFVVATHSLLGVWGGWREDVLILEEDAFGRIMFAYVGGTLTSDSTRSFTVLAVLIAQKTTERYSYFYSGINFILHEIAHPEPEGRYLTAGEFLDEDFVMQHFTADQLEQLKAESSWNEELNEDRFFRALISRRRKSRYMTYVSEEAQREAYLAVVEETQFIVPHDSIPLTMDKDGNIIFFMRGRQPENRRLYTPSVLFMFDADGNLIEGTGVMELIDLWDYRDQLREFKEANGWAFYYR